MTHNNDTLQLKYTFTSRPNPVHASVSGSDPSMIDLEIMLSNPTMDVVTLSKILIRIPVGENISSNLSTSSKLPSPIYDTSGHWKISSTLDMITIAPKEGAKGKITNFILFRLEEIVVNEEAGYVPITISEYDPSGGKAIDKTTYSITKLEADQPVTNFYAEPAILRYPEQPVTIYWECSDQGKEYSYSLHSDSWHPKDCLNAGDCYSWKNGKEGVPTLPLDETTTFALDIIETNSTGHRTIHDTLHTTVRMEMPRISENSYQEESSTGRIVQLHWIAFNSGKCSVLLDDTMIDTDTVTNTYKQGYPVLMPSQGLHQLVLTAHAPVGAAQDTHVFPNVETKPVGNPITVGDLPEDVAVTLDGKVAFVCSVFDNMVTVIDIPTKKPIKTIQMGDTPMRIEITPDGKLAFVSIQNGESVEVIDVAAQKVIKTIATGGLPIGMGISSDGSNLVVSSLNDRKMKVIDVATLEPLSYQLPTGLFTTALAFTPDDKQILVTDNVGIVSVVDVVSREITKRIELGGIATDIAIMPDGKTALAVTQQNVAVIDMGSLEVTKRINTGKMPKRIALSSDASFALVTNDSDENGTVSIISTIDFSYDGSMPAQKQPAGVAITQDNLGVIVNTGSNSVMII